MPEIIDHLASLTGLRDRDTLDVSLAQAMRDLIAPQRVAIYRLVGEQGDERWLTRASLQAESPAATADPAWVDLGDLPRSSDRPEWQECLDTAQVVVARTPGGSTTTLFPVVSDTGAVGVIELRTDKPLGSRAKRLVFGVLRIYRNVQSLLDYSERDTLTGLLNRKIFDDSFYKVASLPLQDGRGVEPERRQASAARYWLGVVDIDHFKHVNDRFGHLIGDEVLLLLSRIMRGSFRFSDQLYRFGGEEFVVLLLCADEGDAQAALERFRGVVEGYPFPQAGTITVSVGFTAIETGDTPAAAFERADRAVYHAKKHGRNQVCSHSALMREGFIEDDKHVGDVELF
jgi:diguanylate cyclase (GGDEF)-like protein